MPTHPAASACRRAEPLLGSNALSHARPCARAAMLCLVLGLAGATVPAAHAADTGEGRPFCADRPGQTSPACTIEPGRVMIELGVGDWSYSVDGSARTHQFTTGDTVIRTGIDDRTELQLGWDGWSRQTTRDPIGGDSRVRGGGDLRVGIVRNLRNPDGSGTAIALAPYATLPVGKDGIGAGTWSAGITVPVTFSLPGDAQFGVTPLLAAEANDSGKGRHAAYGAAVGIESPEVANLTFAMDMSWRHDDDPAGGKTQWIGGTSVAWQLAENWQVDAEMQYGFSRAAPRREWLFGIAHRF